MAKQAKLDPYLLSGSALLLLSAGFLMKPFPVLIFAGLAPLMAVTDHASEDNFWNKLELVGIALAVAIFSAFGFDSASIVTSILQAIALTLVFAAYAYTRQQLGPRSGKLPLVLYLVAVEYVVLKLGIGDRWVFLADALLSREEWFRWTHYTGYLGVTLWILIANVALYAGALRDGIKIPYLIVFLLIIVVPMIYSYQLPPSPATRVDMIGTYKGILKENYPVHGEWIPRTAAWISALIMLYAIIRHNTSKK